MSDHHDQGNEVLSGGSKFPDSGDVLVFTHSCSLGGSVEDVGANAEISSINSVK